jgi:hypothetical protein
MQSRSLSRRAFLKLAGLSLAGLAFRPFQGSGDDLDPNRLIRITAGTVSVYSRPDDKSKILYQRTRDELVNVYDEVMSEFGPGYNPLWYRVWGGYIHSAYTQPVKIRLNSVISNPDSKGVLAEVSVPLTQALLPRQNRAWEPVYRLYYDSTHWITGVLEGPDGSPWYKLKDELLEIEYAVPAEHMRVIQPDELTPLSQDVPPEKKRIEVSLARQEVTAYEDDKVVLHTKIASGLPDKRKPEPGLILTQTPVGEYRVQSKMPSKHMGDGRVTSDIYAYELPGVPWTSFFVPETGVAFHGTYWHTNYGITMSHGCINMKPEEAKWIFRWCTPITDEKTVEKTGYGTRVIVS